MILLSYDGSADAQAAIDHAAQLFPGADAIVLTLWRSLTDTAMLGGGDGMGAGVGLAWVDTVPIDAASAQTAKHRADEGAERAAAAGLAAHARVEAAVGGLARTILTVAEEVDAQAIVLGTRGLHGAQSFFLGSVSHGVLQHAGRPVVIVPSARVVAERRSWFAAAPAAVGVQPA